MNNEHHTYSTKTLYNDIADCPDELYPARDQEAQSYSWVQVGSTYWGHDDNTSKHNQSKSETEMFYSCYKLSATNKHASYKYLI